MDRGQILILVLAEVPTILTVLIGIALQNRGFGRLEARMTSIEAIMARIDNRLIRIEAGQR